MSGGTFNLNGQNPIADQNHSAPVIDGYGTITNSVAGTTGTALFKVGNARTFSGNIVDGAAAAKVAITLTSGASTWTLSGTNTYSGATTVSSGIIQAGSTTALSPNSAFTIASGKNLALNHFNNTIGSLAGAGSVTLGTASLTLGNDNSSSTTFSGVISGVGGSINKTGSGTQTFSGNNTYSGTTTVTSGRLLLTNSTGSAAGSSSINVATNATLGGTGLATGNVTVTGGSDILT